MSVRATRRDVLKIGGAAAASMAMSSLLEAVPAAAPPLAPAWKNLPIGTQAWCVRKEMATDVPGTLAKVRGAGFELIELENAFGYSGQRMHVHDDKGTHEISLGAVDHFARQMDHFAELGDHDRVR